MTWLDEMKARLEAATKGPWFHRMHSYTSGDEFIITREVFDKDEWQVCSGLNEVDAELIANCPSDLTKAIRIIEIYEKALDQVLDITCNTAAALAEAEKIKGE